MRKSLTDESGSVCISISSYNYCKNCSQPMCNKLYDLISKTEVRVKNENNHNSSCGSDSGNSWSYNLLSTYYVPDTVPDT